MPLLIAAIVLASCGADRHRSAETSHDYPRNRQLWAMPLHQFESADLTLSDYAENLLVQPCMSRAGYHWEIPEVDAYAPRRATENDADRKLFNVDIATRFGYHDAPSRRVDMRQVDELRSHVIAPREEASLDRCIKEVRRRLPPPVGSRLIFSFASAAYDAAKASSPVIAAARKWRACMQPYGISDLPDVPSEMPTPSEAKRFGLDDRSMSSETAERSSASPEEIRLAVADARCRETSGYAQTFYDAEWQQQARLIDDNRDALERAKAENARHDKLVREVIAQYGGGANR